MSMAFQPGGLIGAPAFIGNNGGIGDRHSGPVTEYTYAAIKPKKQLKEIRKILLPEKKKFLGIKYGFKYNLHHRCVVCGAFHQWEASDDLRPPIPLSGVNKGRPLQGTYCPKHAGFYKQMEMLEQQILADEHGLEFRSYIPKPKMPKLMSMGPIRDLSPQDVTSLIAAGWVIEPPQGTKETPHMQYTRIMLEVQGKMAQIQKIIPLLESEE